MYPRTIAECKRKNDTVLALERWAKDIMVIGIIIFVCILVGGIVDGIKFADTVEDDNSFGAFMDIFLSSVLWGFVELCSAVAISILLNALASITHSSETTAKLTELCAANKGIPYGEEIITAPTNGKYGFSKPTGSSKAPHTPTVYICKTCGEKSQDMFCSVCGKKKIKEGEHISKKAYTRTLQGNEWKCPACGRINQDYVGTCGCGQKKV